jgi:hypothetical protein
MSDAALREVLRSPLDDRPRSGRGGWAGLAALLAAAAVGFGVTAGVRALTGGEATATTEATTTTAGSPAAAGPALMGEVGAEAMAAWSQGGHLYLVVVTTVLPGQDAEDVAGVPSAHWVLRLAGGDLVAATAELTTLSAPGIFTLEFPETNLAPGADLLAYPAGDIIERTFATTRDSAQFPWSGPLDGDGGVLGASYHLGGEEVAIHEIRLDDGGGEIGWHLSGDSEARAVLTAWATYTEPGAGPQAIVAERDLPLASLVAAADSSPAARSGTIHLFHLDDVNAPSFRSRFFGDPERVVAVEDLDLEIVVRMYRYSTDPAIIPVDLVVAAEE